MSGGVILTCNAGSTNTKLAAFDAKTLVCINSAKLHNQHDALAWLQGFNMRDIRAIGHRVVHGGLKFTHPEVITNDVLAQLHAFIPLAPLHQPAALEWVAHTRALFPNMPNIVCFDTAFHHTIPAHARRLPLPRALHDEGIMKYGFHGLSYAYIASVMPQHFSTQSHEKVIVVHLGGGASACAMQSGISIATTMGFSTLDGLMMGTRCGALDAGVVLHLLQEKHMNPQDVSDLLYHNSGLKGVSNMSGDMKELLESQAPEAQEAVALYCAHAAQQIAGLIPSLGGLDALIFTGGIGEHAELVRELIVDALRWVGEFPVFVISTNEELVIAKACQHIITN